MSYLESLQFEWVSLFENPEIHIDMLEGQIETLNSFGIQSFDFADYDRLPSSGTYAVVVRNESSEIVGGVRVHPRDRTGKLPIESTSSPLDEKYRLRFSNEESICELRGMWVLPSYSGRFLARRMVEMATNKSRQMGYKFIVSLTHLQSLAAIARPLGYRLAEDIPAFDYPNERYKSVVVWQSLAPEGQA